MPRLSKNPFVKPFLKWAGGKRQLLPEIESKLPTKFKSYYEPFVGGGALLFDLQKKGAIINDFNSQLTNVYSIVKDNVDDLIQVLEEHEKLNSKEYYYDVRLWDRDGRLKQKSLVEQAARIIYLNKTGYNGLFRVNSQNQFNVPYGNYKNPAIVNETTLRAVSNYLRKAEVKILTGDFKEAISNVRKDDFVYFDPPYAPISQDSQSFVGYTLTGFGETQQIELRDIFKELSSRGAYVMLSNSDVPFIRKIYQEFKDTTITVGANRNINSNSRGRGKVNEVIITNY